MLYDISPRLLSTTAVFPGDSSLSREVLMDMHDGQHVTVSTLRTTVHIGAHVDAPNHYDPDGRDIDQQPLDLYLGQCQVVDVNVGRGELITLDRLDGPIRAERLLLRTGTMPDPQKFNDDFAALDPAFVDDLKNAGVRLIGIDTPSVDPASSKELPAHRRIAACDLAILEGIVLRDVTPGFYELIALPLRLAGFDASPVRAVLRDDA